MQRIDTFRQRLSSRKNDLGFCFLTVFLWGFLAHGYAFLNTFLSHDLLNAFSATQTEELWKLELGRLFVPVYRFIFRNPVYLPWVIGILGLSWIALSLFFLLEAFEIRSKTLLVFIAGMMTTNITVIAQIATYAYEFDANAFSLLCAILSVFFWHRSKGFLSVAASSLCLFISTGVYQAFIAVTAVLMLFRLILDLLNGETLRTVLLRGLKGLLILSLGLLLYFAGSRAVAALWGIKLQDRIRLVADGGLFTLLQQIPPAMNFLIAGILHPAYQSKVFPLAVFITALLLSASVLRLFIVKKFRADRILLLFLLVGLCPLGMTCVYFAARGIAMHDLTKYAVWLFYIFLLFFAFRLCKKDMLPGFLPRICRAAACLLIGVMLWQNVLLANTAYVKKEREADAALSAMTRVVSMIETGKTIRRAKPGWLS